MQLVFLTGLLLLAAPPTASVGFRQQLALSRREAAAARKWGAGDTPPDTAADEMTDQMDPEFKDIAEPGADCIVEDDVKRVTAEMFDGFEKQLEEVLADETLPPQVISHLEGEKQELQKQKVEVEDFHLCLWREADKIKSQDGCVTKEEFDAAGDMEGNPDAMKACFGDDVEEHGEECAEDWMEGEYDHTHHEGDTGDHAAFLQKPKSSVGTKKKKRCPSLVQPFFYEGRTKKKGDDDDHDHDDQDDGPPPFGVLDADGSGGFTFEEMHEFAEKEAEGKEEEQLPGFVLEAILEFYDVDPADGEVSEAEYSAGNQKMASPEGQQELQELVKSEAPQEPTGDLATAQFEMMDQNNDGKLSQSEFVDACVAAPHMDVGYPKAQEMFKAFDTNEDNFLSFDEFMTAGENYEGDGEKFLQLAAPKEKAAKKTGGKTWARVNAWQAVNHHRSALRAKNPVPEVKPDLPSLRKLFLFRRFGSLKKSLTMMNRKAHRVLRGGTPAKKPKKAAAPKVAAPEK